VKARAPAAANPFGCGARQANNAGVDDTELLRIYDEQVRGTFLKHLPRTWTAHPDGPLVRCLMGRESREGFATLTRDVPELSHDELSALVDRTVAFYNERGVAFEWKTYDHERADLRPLLASAGAVPEPHEALVLGDVAALAAPTVLPDGLTIRRITTPADMQRMAAMEEQVWGDDRSWLAADLAERADGDDPTYVFVVEDGDLVVSAGWLEPVPGTPVAGLWGGSTLAAYRGRGVYRALVAERARLAQRLGYSLLQVDASDDSRPILVRLGLRVVGGTVPYKFPTVIATR
jgi:GNAT superfamily N-acetyltransferase